MKYRPRIYNTQFDGSIQPTVRVGIAMGEVVIADNTITGTGVILAQRLEQLASPGRVVLQGASQETIPGRFPFEYESMGEQKVKGFDESIRAYVVDLKVGIAIPKPERQIDYIKKAMRLNPHYPPVYLYRLGWAQFNLERYNDAAVSLEESILRDPDFLGPRGLLVATYGHLNRIPEGKVIYKGLYEKPDCSWYTQFKKAADQHRLCQGLQKAGF